MWLLLPCWDGGEGSAAAGIGCSDLNTMPANQRFKCKICAINFVSFETGVTPGALCGVVRLRHPHCTPSPWGDTKIPVPKTGAALEPFIFPLKLAFWTPAGEHHRCLMYHSVLLIFIIKAPSSFSWVLCWMRCFRNLCPSCQSPYGAAELEQFGAAPHCCSPCWRTPGRHKPPVPAPQHISPSHLAISSSGLGASGQK